MLGKIQNLILAAAITSEVSDSNLFGQDLKCSVTGVSSFSEIRLKNPQTISIGGPLRTAKQAAVAHMTVVVLILSSRFLYWKNHKFENSTLVVENIPKSAYVKALILIAFVASYWIGISRAAEPVPNSRAADVVRWYLIQACSLMVVSSYSMTAFTGTGPFPVEQTMFTLKRLIEQDVEKKPNSVVSQSRDGTYWRAEYDRQDDDRGTLEDFLSSLGSALSLKKDSELKEIKPRFHKNKSFRDYDMLDHKCGFLLSTIHRGNHLYFVLFLSSLFCLLFMGTTFPWIAELGSGYIQSFSAYAVAIVFSFVLIYVALLWFVNVVQLFHGVTTVQALFAGERYNKESTQSNRHPMLWFLPIALAYSGLLYSYPLSATKPWVVGMFVAVVVHIIHSPAAQFLTQPWLLFGHWRDDKRHAGPTFTPRLRKYLWAAIPSILLLLSFIGSSWIHKTEFS